MIIYRHEKSLLAACTPASQCRHYHNSGDSVPWTSQAVRIEAWLPVKADRVGDRQPGLVALPGFHKEGGFSQDDFSAFSILLQQFGKAAISYPFLRLTII